MVDKNVAASPEVNAPQPWSKIPPAIIQVLGLLRKRAGNPTACVCVVFHCEAISVRNQAEAA